MPIRGVYFDFHDTLTVCDDPKAAWEDWSSGLYLVLRDHGCPLPEEKFRRRCPELFEAPEPPRQQSLTTYECRIEAFCRQMGWHPGRAAVQEAAARSVGVWHAHMRLDPEAVPLLEWLRPRVHVALITNFDHPPHMRSVLDEWNLVPLFSAIAISGELGASKPDPAIFRWALDAAGLEPSEVAFVGDSDTDVQGARDSGCSPIRIRRGSPAVEGDGNEDGVATVTRLSEIPRLLRLT